MAHKKAGGSKARQGGNTKGKCRGVKAFGSQLVKAGSIIIRQKGTLFHAGKNVGLGKDHTIFAKIGGFVCFSKQRGRGFISVLAKN